MLARPVSLPVRLKRAFAAPSSFSFTEIWPGPPVAADEPSGRGRFFFLFAAVAIFLPAAPVTETLPATGVSTMRLAPFTVKARRPAGGVRENVAAVLSAPDEPTGSPPAISTRPSGSGARRDRKSVRERKREE